MYGIKEYIDNWKEEGDFSWSSFWLMFGTFLDRFYNKKDINMLTDEPVWGDIPKEIQSFVSSSVDYLSHNINVETPKWAMNKKYELEEPFFPSKLKGEIRTVMLIESPIEYKVRNIYVLGNILTRC